MVDDNKPTIIAAAVISAICSNMFLMLPLIAAAAHMSLNLTLEQTGILGSYFFGGYVIGSLIGLWAVPNVSWSTLIKILVPAYCISFALCGYFSGDLADLSYALLGAGIISGLMYNVATCICADQKNADAAFGARLFSEQILAGILLFLLPVILGGTQNLSLIFYILAAVYGIGIIVIKYIPQASQKSQIRTTVSTNISISFITFKLATFSVYFAGLSAVWAFIEILGQQWGYEGGTITQLLSLGVLGGALGAFFATIQGNRFGSKIPHVLTGVLMAMITLSFMSGKAGLLISTAVVVLPGVWNYMLAYQLGQLASFDTSGKVAPFLAPMLGFGAAAGPIAGGMIADSMGMTALLQVTLIIIVICTVGFIWKSSIKTN